MKPSRPWLCLPAAILLGASVPAQVVVNEVLYDPTGQDAGKEVIEVANLSRTAASLTGWALCVGFRAPLSRAYWSFPNGTSIPAGGFLRVHWLAAGTNTSADMFTGTSAGSFSCLLPPQLLDNAVGSVALYRTQGCLAFSSPAGIADFVQWGGSTFRESVAVAARIWPAGGAVKPVAEGHSIAYDGAGNTPGDYFDDLCPTLGARNTGPGKGVATNYGKGCRGTNGVPVIVAAGGPPALGNQSFAIDLRNALRPAPAILVLGAQRVSVPVFGCTLLVLPLVTTVGVSGNKAPLPLPCNPSLAGVSLFFQWFVLDPRGPRGISASNGLQAVL